MAPYIDCELNDCAVSYFGAPRRSRTSGTTQWNEQTRYNIYILISWFYAAISTDRSVAYRIGAYQAISIDIREVRCRFVGAMLYNRDLVQRNHMGSVELILLNLYSIAILYASFPRFSIMCWCSGLRRFWFRVRFHRSASLYTFKHICGMSV